MSPLSMLIPPCRREEAFTEAAVTSSQMCQVLGLTRERENVEMFDKVSVAWSSQTDVGDREAIMEPKAGTEL